MKSLRDFDQGRLILWAWASRGMVSKESIAEWKFNGDLAEVNAFLNGSKGSLAALLSLDETPDVTDEHAKALTQEAEGTILAGEAVSHWCLIDLDVASSSDSGTQPMPLPGFFKIPVDRTIAVWKKELDDWNKRKEKRMKDKGTDELPPAQKTKYQNWIDHGCTRRILINKSKGQQVVNIQAKSLRSMAKHCIIVTLILCEDASQLRLRAGDGKVYKLVLLKGVKPAEDLPQHLDHAPGLV